MAGRKLTRVSGVLCAMGIASIAQAAVIMDATTNNGSFNGSATDYWSNATPAGWGPSLVKNHIFTVYEIPMAYWDSTGINNTGIQVTANTQYTVSALLSANVGLTANVWVIATQNADGTGAQQELAHISYSSGTTSGPTYSPRTNTDFMTAVGPTTGAATSAALAGYYVQVKFGTTDFNEQYYSWYDDIVVTSEVVPEPAALGIFAAGGLCLIGKRRRVC